MSSPESPLDPALAARLHRTAEGLVPVVVQQHGSGEVLMLAWADDEALSRTIDTGRATYWSRSRREYWVKGDTSGHVQWVKEIRLDCDGDTLLFVVDQVGAACHTGDHTCFDADLVHHVGVEARVVAGVARGSHLVDDEQEGVAVAVEADLLDPLDVAGGVALGPVLAARARPVRRPAGVDRAVQRLVVDPGQHQHLAGAVLLHHDGHQALRGAPQARGDRRVEG